MSDIEKLCATFADIGICYTRRKEGEYEYVFVGECRNIYNPDWSFQNSDLGNLVRSHKFIEFENGSLVSHFNS